MRNFSNYQVNYHCPPLEVLKKVWEDLALDFFVGLPNSKGNTTILVVVDRLTKYAHFGALPSDYTVAKVAKIFYRMVIKLHGLPRNIVSIKIFTS